MPKASVYTPVVQISVMPLRWLISATNSTSRPRSLGHGSITVRTP